MLSAWSVAKQELLATLRDRRTLSSTILVPLLIIPLITVGLPLLLGSLIGGESRAKQVVGTQGDVPPALRALLERSSGEQAQGVRLVVVQQPLSAVQSGQVDAALSVEGHLPRAAGEPGGAAQLYYKVGNIKAENGAANKVRAAVAAYNRQLVSQKLSELKLSPGLLSPVTLSTVNAANAAESRSGALAFLIPLFLLQFILAGATATATDATAGERERGTFEALLATPAPRHTLLLGKLLATTLTALVAATFSVIGLTLSAPVALLLSSPSASQKAAQSAFGGSLSLGPLELGALLLTAASAALLISATLLTLSLFARSVREAQTLITPLTLLIVLPATLLQFSDFLKASSGIYAAPLMGSMLLILDTVKGALSLPHLLLSVLSNVLAAGALTLIASRLFGRENVAFR